MFRKFIEGRIAWPVFEPADIVGLRTRYNLTPEALAVLIGVSAGTVTLWESGEEKPSGPGMVALCVLSKLGSGIFTLMDGRFERFTLHGENLRDEDLTAEVSDDMRYNRLSKERYRTPPANFDAQYVRMLRSDLGLSRKEFSDLLDISPSTLDKWEGGAVTPKGPALLILQILWKDGVAAIPSHFNHNEKNDD